MMKQDNTDRRGPTRRSQQRTLTIVHRPGLRAGLHRLQAERETPDHRLQHALATGFTHDHAWIARQRLIGRVERRDRRFHAEEGHDLGAFGTV
jgi:hypothetical protein